MTIGHNRHWITFTSNDIEWIGVITNNITTKIVSYMSYFSTLWYYWQSTWLSRGITRMVYRPSLLTITGLPYLEFTIICLVLTLNLSFFSYKLIISCVPIFLFIYSLFFLCIHYQVNIQSYIFYILFDFFPK